MKFREFAGRGTAWQPCRPGWYVAWLGSDSKYQRTDCRSQTFGLQEQAEAYARELEEGHPGLTPRIMTEEKSVLD